MRTVAKPGVLMIDMVEKLEATVRTLIEASGLDAGEGPICGGRPRMLLWGPVGCSWLAFLPVPNLVVARRHHQPRLHTNQPTHTRRPTDPP
jgi:hypothetical protein